MSPTPDLYRTPDQNPILRQRHPAPRQRNPRRCTPIRNRSGPGPAPSVPGYHLDEGVGGAPGDNARPRRACYRPPQHRPHPPEKLLQYRGGGQSSRRLECHPAAILAWTRHRDRDRDRDYQRQDDSPLKKCLLIVVFDWGRLTLASNTIWLLTMLQSTWMIIAGGNLLRVIDLGFICPAMTTKARRWFKYLNQQKRGVQTKRFVALFCRLELIMNIGTISIVSPGYLFIGECFVIVCMSNMHGINE